MRAAVIVLLLVLFAPFARADGDLDKDAIDRVMKMHAGTIRACFEKSLQTHPKLAGKVVVTFTIATSGKVTEASATGMDQAPEVGPCIVKQVKRFVFPKPTGGQTSVSYPFVFTSS